MTVTVHPNRFGRRSFHAGVLGAALLAGLAVDMSPAGKWLERAIWPARFAAVRRPASGQVVIVEMDAASVATLRQWPWSRSHHAAVVDQLRRAGAATITFDVDFSSASPGRGDHDFAGALRRADGKVALPTFAQAAGSSDLRSMDALPLPLFREHAALASVSIAPDSDGIVRRAPYGTMTDGLPRPSLAAWIARRSGRSDATFPIAFGIDPATIPRLSFAAVRKGQFDPARVRGRDMLIGATAIEMGDRYATPLWGVIPGVTIQALAAETLFHGLPSDAPALPLIGLAILIGAAALRIQRLPLALTVLATALAGVFGVAVLVQLRLHLWMQVAPSLVAIVLVMAGRVGMHLATRFDRQRCTDEVTGLPNRRAMLRVLNDQPGTVAVALIANFESLLTYLGEAAERDIILRLTERLRIATGKDACFRVSERLIAFVLPSDEDADDLSARLRALLLQPIEVAGRRIDTAVHIGLADTGPTLADRLTAAIKAAEEAVGIGEFWHNSAIDREDLERRVSLMGELDEALAAGEIDVHYQPKLSLIDDRITSVEALVRWKHPVRGAIRPDLFIPLAEQTDRIGPLTHYVLKRVVSDLAAWHRSGLDLNAAVNVSARLVADADFEAVVRHALASTGVDAAKLTLEVTESATLSDPEAAAAALRRYRDLGCSISMDDYGTGQSTLSYLQVLPLSELKIDRSFVQNAHRNPADALMVRSTIDLAHGLGLKVVAEGIEDEACLKFLRACGCDMAQGYLVGRPVPRLELEAGLRMPRKAA